MSENYKPWPDRIGILGGGQLGLMMAEAASDWHLEPIFLDPDPDASVKPYANLEKGDFKDYETVMAFGEDKDLISFEIESVNLLALKDLEKSGKKVFPQPSVLEIIKNKWTQKQFLKENGFPVSDFKVFEKNEREKNEAFLPAFWKQNEGGYDGKGVQSVKNAVELQSIPAFPGFLEKKVDIEKEIAVLAARNENGETSLFPLVEQVFHPVANLVSFLKTPAEISPEQENQCREIAREILKKLNMVGLLAIEFFLDKKGNILVNELAPRPHNSGHHSIEGFQTSQFQQFWRAILNLPLGDTKPIFPYSAMVNLIGEEGNYGIPVYQGFKECLALSGVFIHLYGKAETRPFRKMGHITIVAHTLAELDQKVSFVQNHLKVISRT
jgi:5-(carboxyamino)imidazole ribonucleotide synthase